MSKGYANNGGKILSIDFNQLRGALKNNSTARKEMPI
jgi:hypothetical protein